ncbi:MAG TPA: glutathione S-transferase family protein [Pseudomonadales bacterium]|nr:glutathione S-transferase family protein [Pseudomonadales bacterium]
MITLYQYEISPFCDKIRRILNYKKLPYHIHEVSLLESVNGAYKKINPIGKVPAIDHDGRIVADSTHIANYIEEKYPQPPLIPTNKKDAALVHMLEDWADESLYFFEMYLRLAVPHNAERWIPEITKNEPFYMKLAAPKLIPAMLGKVAKTQGTGRKPLEMLSKEVYAHVKAVADWLADGSWLVGDAITLADISVYSQLKCLEGTREGAFALNDFPSVLSWMKRVDQATCVRSV